MNKQVRDRFASGPPLLDLCVTDQLASEAVHFGLKLEFKELLGKKARRTRLETAEVEMLYTSKPEVTYVISVLQTPSKLIG